ncbi:MAG TPA: ABC transporter ATP-binding protein [Candidatus Ozemobacteraceae bacterium]|nr:ABC transporter ATP-binding protein [Candidatus Ozemobacteraceae bacterium]
MPAIAVENLCFHYDSRKPVLDSLSFTIEAGSVTSILGPNGSGKTTLLKLLLGLKQPVSGTILIAGRPIDQIPLAERAKLLAYVPQQHSPIFSYKSLDVAAMGRVPHAGIFCSLKKNDLEIARQNMARLGIEHLADRPYTEISGGEQQLVLIARALSQGAGILILDEPVAGLDYGNQLLLLKHLRNLAGSGITCIKTTHYPEHALWTSDQAIFIKNGRVAACGSSEKIINSEMLQQIYGAKINVIETNAGAYKIRTCVPEF